jgi:hypothetical protein
MNDKLLKKALKESITRTSYKSWKELKKDLKGTWVDSVRYQLWHRPINFIDDLLKWKVKNHWQRMIRGWGFADTWGLDYYLAPVIRDSIKYLAKNIHGVPCDIANKYHKRKDLTPKQKDMLMVREWRLILNEISEGFDAICQNLENYPYNKELYNKNQKKFEKALDLLKVYFINLWD